MHCDLGCIWVPHLLQRMCSMLSCWCTVGPSRPEPQPNCLQIAGIQGTNDHSGML